MAKTIPKEKYSKLLKKRSTPESKARFRKRFDIGKPGKKKSPKGERVSKTFEGLHRKEIQAGTELEFGDTERELQSQQRAEGFRTQQVGNWYQDYLNKINAAKAESVARDNALVQGSQQRAQQSQTQSDESSQKLQQEMQADAAKRGAAVNPKIAAEAQQASASRRTSANQQTDFLATLGRNQSAFMDQYALAGSKGAIEAQTTQQSRERKAAQQITDLARKKGAFRTDFVRQLKDTEVQKQLERGALEAQGAKINLDELKFEETVRSNKAGERIQRRGQNVTKRGQNLQKMNQDRRFKLDVKKFGRDSAKDRYQRRHKVGPYSKSGKKGKSDGPGKMYEKLLGNPLLTDRQAIQRVQKRYPNWKPKKKK